MYKKFIIALLTIISTACSSLPENLATSNTNLITQYQSWSASDLSVPNEVRVGGVIAKVTNLSNRTRIEVVNMPINDKGKPNLSSEPKGRYVVYIEGYVESMALSQGRLITFLGVSDGQEQGKVGAFDIQFPVLKATSYHLWRVEERVVINEHGSHMSPCWGLNCRSRRPSTSSGRVIQEVK